MSEEENSESKDQPVKESDQPKVDSNDEEENLDEDQPQVEESEEEESIPQEELKAGYMRQSDYTKKTQELAEMRKEIEALKRANIYLYTTGISKEEQNLTAVNITKEPELVIEESIKRHNNNNIAIIPEGPYVVPRRI